jgi:hypothetical protein
LTLSIIMSYLYIMPESNNISSPLFVGTDEWELMSAGTEEWSQLDAETSD